MARRALAGAMVAAVLALAAGAPAAHGRLLESDFAVTGDVAVTWTGPGGVEGSVLFSPGQEGSVGVDARTGGLRTVSGRGGDQEPTIVRVRRPGPDGAPVACVDRLGEFFGGVSFDGRNRRALPPEGPLEVSIGGGGFEPAPLSAARCAGPVTADLAEVLPVVPLDLRRLRKAGTTLAFDTRRTFAAGAFDVALESNVKVRLGRAQVRREGDRRTRSRPARPRGPRRVGVVTLRYAVERVEGAVVTDFRGVPGFECAPLDACGLAGTNRVSLAGARGQLTLSGTVPVPRRGRRLAAARALRELRRGRLDVGGATSLSGDASVTAAVSRDGAPACRDERVAAAPSLEIFPGRDGLRAVLSPPGADELSRTRCPGPGLSRRDGPVGLAEGTVRAADLAGSELRLVLRPEAGFSGPYAATAGGEIALTLRRLAVRARVVRAVRR